MKQRFLSKTIKVHKKRFAEETILSYDVSRGN